MSRASEFSGADDIYDSSRVPGKVRWMLPLPSLNDTLKYGRDSLQLVREHWASHGNFGSFAYLLRSATFHEDWHAESFYHTRQKFSYPAPPTAFSIRPRLSLLPNSSHFVRVPGGKYLIGASKTVPHFVFDNEKPEVRVSYFYNQYTMRNVAHEDFSTCFAPHPTVFLFDFYYICSTWPVYTSSKYQSFPSAMANFCNTLYLRTLHSRAIGATRAVLWRNVFFSLGHPSISRRWFVMWHGMKRRLIASGPSSGSRQSMNGKWRILFWKALARFLYFCA